MPDQPTFRYRMKLKPVTSYYFGDERGFGVEEKQNYLVKSRHWPQQTTLLGMLRYLLLREKGLLAATDQQVSPNAAALIGAESFRLDAGQANLGGPLDFGAIRQIGPLYLLDGDTAWFPAPLFHGKAAEPQAAHAWLGYGKQPAMLLEGYDAKEYEAAKLISAAGDLISQGDVFLEQTQTGIHKSRNGQPHNEAFYKQTSVTLKKKDGKKGYNWTFAFTVETTEPLPAKGLVPMGGEQRMFAFEAEPEKQDPPRYALPAGMKPCLVLLSDALVDPEVYAHCEFATVHTLDFRFLKTSIGKTSRYHNVSRDNKTTDLVKSEKFTLLEKGSVLYPRDNQQVQALISLPRLQQIGYNHFQPFTS